MKILSWLIFATVCVFFVSCEKPQSEADRNAQIEKEVQARLDAERQAQEKDRLAQQSADVEAREKALAAKEAATRAPQPTATARVVRQERESSSAERPSQSYDTFYRKLEPHGAWRESADYGYVWQPRAAQQSRNWRPYTDGRWAYTDAGWTWVSNEPFGWATYHYGRWIRLSGVGWVWVPGDEWAPAWVSWRTSNQHVGWAPLPPEARFEKRTGIKHWADNYYDIDAGEYVFVPNEDIGDENVQRAVIPAERNVTIVNETTNVTNITYNNTMIVNEGPNYDQLREHSRRPLERLRLQREYNVEQEQNPRAAVSGETLQVITPLFTARATEKPRTAAPAIQRATVERIATGDQAEAARAQQKMKSEATPPPDAPSKKFEKPAMAEGTPAPAATTTPAPAATTAATTTPAPTAAATLTPKPTPGATASATAAPQASPTSTPLPTATPRPTSTPRPLATAPLATPPPAAESSPTQAASPAATARPTFAPRATPAAPTATPMPTDSGEPKPTQVEGPDQRAVKQDEQLKRQQAREKALEMNRGLRGSPTPAAETSPAMAVSPAVPPRRLPPQQPRPTISATVAATPAPQAETPDQRAPKLDDRLKPPDAREKASEANRNLRASPTPAAETSPTPASPAVPPRQTQTQQPNASPLPADMTEGTPAGLEVIPTPQPPPKRPPRAIPSATPSPTAGEP